VAKRSAGVLLWKRDRADVRVLLVHPGGPFWARKDDGAWSIPKGEYAEDENALATARRELLEELGPAVASLGERPDDAFGPLGEIKQKGGKFVTAFALEADFDVTKLASNTFELEWPPRSGRLHSHPEVDRAGWFSLEEARVKILVSQLPFLTAFAEHIARH
jgi:predicted NUDIX family NTP pyrophosphohydrolase